MTAQWGEIWSQSPEFGWCVVDPEVAKEAERSGVALNVIQPGAPAGRGLGSRIDVSRSCPLVRDVT